MERENLGFPQTFFAVNGELLDHFPLPSAIIAKVGGTLTFTAAPAQKPLVF
jgi:hypothetical protein